MQCLRCEASNREGRRFCASCGALLLLACPACQFENELYEEFCGGCGRPMPRAETRGPAQGLSPQAYTPRHLADRILTSRGAMEGERKHVTVLFCDLVESSHLAEQLDPEEMHQIMDRVLRLMAEAVHRYEGTVNQFLGDGLMALFGAPVALEDHALRAVEAALAIQETIAGYGVQVKHERGVGIQLRVGLNTGPVVVGRIGDDLRMDYTAVGDTTNLAARLQGLAEPGTILVSEATHRAVEGHVRSEPLGPVQVKGRAQPVLTFRITGRRRRSRFEVRAERGLTPLVGRGQDLALLHNCLARAQAGRGQVVGLVGEPGVGKSRLLFEFRAALRNEKVTWLEGHCASDGQTIPYFPILEILRANFQIEAGDNPLQTEAKLRQGLRELGIEPDRVLPFLRELFNIPAEDDVLKHLDPQMKRRRVFEAIHSLTVAGTRQRPLVLVLEDLHWIDRTSEDYLAFAVGNVAGLRLLLVTTHRPGYVVRWADKAWYTQLALDLLAEGDTRAMVETLLGTRDLPPDLVRRILEKAEGNPLSVEEITTSLVERKVLVRRNGGLRWTKDADVDFPTTIQDIVRARIDRLEEGVKSTVQIASAIGREFSVRLLAGIVGNGSEIEKQLDTLKRLELINETRFFPEPEWAFKHAVIQDVAYHSLLAHRRSELHAAIGRAIEELYADQVEERAGRLTHHYHRGERPDKVVQYALLAGDRAARLYAVAEAKTYYGAALGAVDALPASPEAERTKIDLSVKLAGVGVTRDDFDRNRANLERARALAERLRDETRLSRVLYWLGRLQYVVGNLPGALEYARQSLEIAEQLGDDAIVAPPVNLMGRIYWIQSDYVRASQMLERSVEQMLRVGNKGEESTAAATVGCVFGLMGEFERAFRYADRGVQLAEEIQNPFAEAAAYQQRGIVHDQRGEWTEAIGDYQAGRALAERVGDHFRVFVLKSWEGRARAMIGDVSAGRVLVEESLALAAQIGTKMILGWQKTFLAACHLALGEAASAASLSEEAIRAAVETGDKLPTALAHRTLAEAVGRLPASDRARAAEAIREAVRILEAIGARPELARTHESQGQLLAGWGEREAARGQLARSVQLFGDMGMRGDLARAEAALAGLGAS
jgi:class 3 adenylate cyclase/tetratricopeptide (TPR) repeat protein